MRAPILFLALCCAAAAQAQLLDSIALFATEKPRFVAKLDLRGGFINNRNIRVASIKTGLEHAGRFQYGIGYAFLFSPVERDRPVPGQGQVNTRLRIGYFISYVDYAFYQRGPWEARLPVQLGAGAGSSIYRDVTGHKRRLKHTGLIVYEPAMTVQYRFLKYLAVGGGWGFRLVWQTGGDLDERLSAPIYTFGLRVFFGDLWRDMGPKDR